MTGFGRGQSENRYAAANVELRSVNGKGLHMKFRLPHERMELEPKLEALLRRQLERGSVQGLVSVQVMEAPTPRLNIQTLKRYLAAWKRAEKELGLPPSQPTMAELLSLPGAQQSTEEPAVVTKGVQQVILAAAEEALQALLEAQAKEGARLRRELQRLGKQLKTLRNKVLRRIPQAKKLAAQRLQERAAKALEAAAQTDPIDLSRELVLLAERADVQEEVARLAMHLERYFELMEKGGFVGRELEFVVQECHREITTMGNKSSDQGMSELVIAMKTVVQQMKEQLANVA